MPCRGTLFPICIPSRSLFSSSPFLVPFPLFHPFLSFCLFIVVSSFWISLYTCTFTYFSLSLHFLTFLSYSSCLCQTNCETCLVPGRTEWVVCHRFSCVHLVWLTITVFQIGFVWLLSLHLSDCWLLLHLLS